MTSRRVVIALGGNAMTGPDGSATPGAQRDAIHEAAQHIADVVATGVEVVLTHGNGPQVGNLCRPCHWTGVWPRPRRPSASP